jgi:hypothetical protein
VKRFDRVRFEAAGIIPAIEIRGDPQSGLGLCGAGIVEDLLVGIQRFTGPIAGDFGKKAMLDRVPFGSAGGIGGYGYGENKGIGQLCLKLCFQAVTAAAVAAAGINEDEQPT